VPLALLEDAASSTHALLEYAVGRFLAGMQIGHFDALW
jgi:hypothetical protein